MHACISHAGVSPQPCLVLSDWLPGRKTEARMGNGAWAQPLSCRDAPARLQRATQQWALTRSLFSCPLALFQQQHGVRGARSCLALCRPSSPLISQNTALYCAFPTLSVLAPPVAPPVLPCAGSGRAPQPQDTSLTFPDTSHLQKWSQQLFPLLLSELLLC